MNTKSFYGRNSTLVTTLEVNDIVEAADHVLSVVVLPPEAGDSQSQDTDEEDVNDNPDDIFEPAGQLEVEEEVGENEDEPTRGKRRRLDSRWLQATHFDTDLQPTLMPRNGDLMSLGEMSPYTIWQRFFTEDMIEYVTTCTNRYAHEHCNNPNFTTSPTEIRKFCGILLLSGYHEVPHVSNYWSTQPDLGVPAAFNTMSRNRFQEIKRYIHFADNKNLQPGDKMAKISPMYNKLNQQLVQYGMFHDLLSVDESMVPYYGRHSSKMFIKGKPIRFGYKLWCLCGSDGYPYHLILYQGKEAMRSKEPLGIQVIGKMVNVIEQTSETTRHELFFDNFFTSHDLMQKLASQSMRATGTVRENRINSATKTMISHKELKKQGRGSFDYRCDGTVYVSKWNDNSIVHICSNYSTHLPVHRCKRRVKGATLDVPQPHLIAQYNKGMGGVDLMDRLLASYRSSIRGKKWYWPLFTNMLNITVVAAWRSHCATNNTKLSHLEFLRHITMTLLQSETQKGSRALKGARYPTHESRYDGMNHIPGTTSQGRCKVCKKNTKTWCTKCQIRLHSERGGMCFDIFHNVA